MGGVGLAVEEGLLYLYKLYDGNPDNVKKFPKLLSKFVYVFIKLEAYERAEEWLIEWEELQPSNEEAKLVREYIEKKIAKEKNMAKNEILKVPGTKSSYFTMRNLLVVAVVMWAISFFGQNENN